MAPRGSHGRDHRPHFVYQLWGAHGECLYVGCTSDLLSRLLTHSKAHWFEDVREVKAKRYMGRTAALNEERHLIATHQPTHNVQGTERDSLARKARTAQGG